MLLYSLLIKFLVLLISAAERIQVEHFFQDSALSERPVVSDNNNNYKFLYSAIHNNRLNALYISAQVIGPITFLLSFITPRWVYSPELPFAYIFIHNINLYSRRYCIYTPGWREAIIVKHLAPGHKCHDWDSNPRSDDLTIRTWIRCSNPPPLQDRSRSRKCSRSEDVDCRHISFYVAFNWRKPLICCYLHSSLLQWRGK